MATKRQTIVKTDALKETQKATKRYKMAKTED